MEKNIHDYIKKEEAEFQTEEVSLGDNWHWNFRKHVQIIFHLKNGVFFTGENDFTRAFKQIMRPLLRLSYWTEDIELKDVVFFIEQRNGRVLSFLIKKYHDEVYARENDLDKMFDDITESDIDFGGVLLQKTNKMPEVVALNSVAFCDQTNLLGGARGFKHYFSPNGLRKMAERGWGDEKNGADITLDELITLADFTQDTLGSESGKQNQVPSKTIEVYIVRGPLPEHYLEDNDNFEDWYDQAQVVAFYKNRDREEQHVTLFRKRADEADQMFHASEPVHGRALGYCDGEMLLHPQIWSNFLTIHKTKLLEAASKVVLQTDDPNWQNNNEITDMENLEVTTTSEGRKIDLVPTVGGDNIAVISNAVNEWFEAAQLDAAAFDPILGKEATSGTTFRGQERTVAQGRGWHDRRRGQRAKFIEKIYREIIIPDIVKEIKRGQKFLANLTVEELTWVVDQLATNQANQKIKDQMMNGEVTTPEEQGTLTQILKDQLLKEGNKKVLEILESDFEDVEVKMGINVAGKQKDLVNLSDKILSIFQFVFQNPQAFQQAMQVPALAKSFQDILEFSGLNQSDFLSLMQAPQITAPEQQDKPTQPLATNTPTNGRETTEVRQ